MMKRIKQLLLSVLMMVLLVACGGVAKEYMENYDLGMRYLNDGNYEDAVLAFKEAIEIDPKKPEAYIGAADAYILMGQKDKAIEILNRGYAETGFEEIMKKLQELKTPD